MKSSSERIEPVRKVAAQNEKKAAESLTKAQSNYNQAQSKLEELIRYRVDYLAEFQFRAQKGMSGSQLQHYKAFLAQLDKAIETQQSQIEQLRTQVAQQRKSWQTSNQRTQVVSKYQDKVKSREITRKNKAEERRMEDDINNNQYSRPQRNKE